MKTMPAGPYPVDVSLCVDERDWERTLRRRWRAHGGEAAAWPQKQRASVEPFTYTDGSLWLVAVFTPAFRLHPLAARVGVIAHEATHIWQAVRAHCGVAALDHEVEAHAVEWYAAWLTEQLHAEGWLKP